MEEFKFSIQKKNIYLIYASCSHTFVLWHQYTYMSKKWDWNYAAELKIMIMYQYTTGFQKAQIKRKKRENVLGHKHNSQLTVFNILVLTGLWAIKTNITKQTTEKNILSFGGKISLCNFTLVTDEQEMFYPT